jgi:hypothetical protein
MDEREAYVELSFSPTVKLVTTVRRFVQNFYTEVLGDAEVTARLTLATHELLENAVRYSIDGHTSIRIAVTSEGGKMRVSIDTKNRAPSRHIQTLSVILDAIAAATDPEEHFQEMMRRTSLQAEGSGLGLGRIRAESGMQMSYRIEGDLVSLTARAEFGMGEVA